MLGLAFVSLFFTLWRRINIAYRLFIHKPHQYCLRIEQINNAITTRLLVPLHTSPRTCALSSILQDNQKLSLCFFQIVKEQGNSLVINA